jgi:hypothetical protein
VPPRIAGVTTAGHEGVSVLELTDGAAEEGATEAEGDGLGTAAHWARTTIASSRHTIQRLDDGSPLTSLIPAVTGKKTDPRTDREGASLAGSAPR